MDALAMFYSRINAKGTDSTPRALSIIHHYSNAITKGMNINIAFDRCSRDIAGDNYHPKCEQRSGHGSTIKQEA